MRMHHALKAIGSATRLAVLGAGALLLAGCATGYSFVQPDMAGSGGYYTSDGSYSGQGYYDYYGTGPYYPVTSGWGYYAGTWPYSDPYGWYGGYEVGSSLTFGFGFSDTWGVPGYWGPWYSSNWGCASWYGCGGWRHDRHHRHHNHDPASPKPWLTPDHPPVPPRVVRGTGSARPVAMPSRPTVRHVLHASPASLPNEFVHAPLRRPLGTNPSPMPWRPAHMPTESAFADHRGMSMHMTTPRGMHPLARPVFRSPPATAAPMVTPAAHSTRAQHDRVQ